MSAQRFLVNVKVWRHMNMWMARSEQMHINLSSNSIDGVYGLILGEFKKQYAGKTGKLQIETEFVCLDAVETVEAGGEEEAGWP